MMVWETEGDAQIVVRSLSKSLSIVVSLLCSSFLMQYDF